MTKQEAPYQLITQLNHKEERAFYAIFHQLYPAMASFANKLLRDESLAQEVCADSFIKLYQSAEVFAGIVNVKAWLFTVTKYGCLDAIKKIKHRTQFQKDLQQMLEADDRNFIAQQEIESELIELIYLSIEKLPNRCRRVFQMSMKGMSYDEIATALKVSISTVRNQKARGLKLLKMTVLKERGLRVSAATISVVLSALFGSN
jgi:RNA polymerase sigma-70 factor (ECF subfamily)